MKGGGKEKKLY